MILLVQCTQGSEVEGTLSEIDQLLTLNNRAERGRCEYDVSITTVYSLVV